LFASDILKVFYAPHKIFKKIVENPKYWGAIAVFILFIALQTGATYLQYEKIHYEQTFPSAYNTALSDWTDNSTLWQVSPSSALVSNNNFDTLNNTYYGNSSLQFVSFAGNNISMTLTDFDSVKCGPDSYQNLSMRIKIASPSGSPTSVILTLYSITESNYFQYDLTSCFSNTNVDTWNNITVPVGSEASNWLTTGDASWANITSLNLEFAFAEDSDISICVQGLFFRDFYQTYMQINSTYFIITILQQVVFQFIFHWLLFTGIMFIVIKGLKGAVVWKPLFIAVGFALAVLLIQALIGFAALATLPEIFSPMEYQTALAGEYEVIHTTLMTQTATHTTITAISSLIIYAWTAILGAFIAKALVTEFTWSKSILTGTAAIVVTIVLMGLLGV